MKPLRCKILCIIFQCLHYFLFYLDFGKTLKCVPPYTMYKDLGCVWLYDHYEHTIVEAKTKCAEKQDGDIFEFQDYDSQFRQMQEYLFDIAASK